MWIISPMIARLKMPYMEGRMIESKLCPVCQRPNEDNWPIHVNGEIKTGGCQDCWERECAESWHEMVENIGWMKLVNENSTLRSALKAADAVIECYNTRAMKNFPEIWADYLDKKNKAGV
jgi:hypothetical protein